MNLAYFPSRYCLSSVNGTSTSSWYNSTNYAGLAVASNLTSTPIYYVCNNLISIKKAEMVEVMVATLMAAVSLLYIA